MLFDRLTRTGNRVSFAFLSLNEWLQTDQRIDILYFYLHDDFLYTGAEPWDIAWPDGQGGETHEGSLQEVYGAEV